MNKDEQNLLMYLETCLVDYRGKVTGARMNSIDFDIAKGWIKDKLIEFQRIPFREINKESPFPVTHTVKFSSKAWEFAQQFRRERAEKSVDTMEKR